MTNDGGMVFGLSGSGAGFESCHPTQWPALARWADKAGFHSLWLNEEHFQARDPRLGGRHVLSPLLAAAAMAVHSRRIRLGFSVLLMPLHQPVRLAEELASLDCLSRGRVDFGVSRGGSPQYLAALQAANDGQRRDFVADLEQVLACWSAHPIQAGSLAVQVHPKPVQRPHPPIYVGTYNPDLTRWTAAAGHQIIIHGIQSPSHAAGNLAAFVAAGGDPTRVPFGRFVYVGATDQQVRSDLYPTLVQLTERLRQVAQQREGQGFLDESLLSPDTFLEHMVIAGSADTVKRKVARLRDDLGVRHINLLSAFFGYLPPLKLRASLKRFAADVIPAFASRSMG